MEFYERILKVLVTGKFKVGVNFSLDRPGSTIEHGIVITRKTKLGEQIFFLEDEEKQSQIYIPPELYGHMTFEQDTPIGMLREFVALWEEQRLPYNSISPRLTFSLPEILVPNTKYEVFISDHNTNDLDNQIYRISWNNPNIWCTKTQNLSNNEKFTVNIGDIKSKTIIKCAINNQIGESFTFTRAIADVSENSNG